MAPLSTQNQQEKCLSRYEDFPYKPGVEYCEAYFDSFLCWQPTPSGSTAFQNCPAARLSDTSKLAFRVCGEDGLWMGRRLNESSPTGWTNYTPCFPTEVKLLFDQVSEDENAQIKFLIARYTRYMEIIGFTTSLIALALSLFIFLYFQSLRNNRTRIHKSLFSAMLVQVLIRLIVYLDQEFVRNLAGDPLSSDGVKVHGIDNMPYVCEISYVMLEYAITVMFLWMFIEGLYLNSLVTTNAMKNRNSHFVYFSIGWGLPLIITIIWATVTSFHYREDVVQKCWYGYNFLPIYWIVQGPRLAVVVINFVFLMNILRVLFIKLRRSESTEVARVKKALRAALVLLPLLGITNALDMTEAPLVGNVWRFAVWSFSTHFLRSFQGFFIALLYCFLNGEVRSVIRKHFENKRAIRETRRQRQSLFRNNGLGIALYDPQFSTSQTKTEATQTRIQLRPLHWSRIQYKQRYAESRISLPSIQQNRRSTGTETDIVVPRRASAFASLEHAVISAQYEQEVAVEVHECPFRRSDSRLLNRVQQPETNTMPKRKLNLKK